MFVVVFSINKYWYFNLFSMITEVIIGIIIYMFVIMVLRPTILQEATVLVNLVKSKFIKNWIVVRISILTSSYSLSLSGFKTRDFIWIMII